VESVLPDFVLHSEIDAGMRAALQMDLIVMMLNTVGAKERTLQEFRQLAMAAGFASVCVVVTVDFLSVLEFNKA
jgi:hypothetical protein